MAMQKQKSSALKRSLPLGYSVLRQELETEVGGSLVGFVAVAGGIYKLDMVR